MRQTIWRTLIVLILSLGLLTTSIPAESDTEVTVYVTRTGAKYHKGTCRYLKQSKIKMTLADAKDEGYTACKVCKPPK